MQRPTPAVATLTTFGPLLIILLAGCSTGQLTSAEAQKLIENSPRFMAPDVMRVRPRYCAAVDAPSDTVTSGLARLKALEGTGAIRIDRRAAAPNECASIPGPVREWLTISLTDTGAGFHPRPLESGEGWEFTLARRRLVSIGEVTFNDDEAATIAHTTYRWVWRAELLGQLLGLSQDPVNAQATFTRRDGQWMVRDVGF